MSLELVAETLSGTAEMLAHHSPDEIQAAVALARRYDRGRPGGALRANGFDDAIAAAVQASLERFR